MISASSIAIFATDRVHVAQILCNAVMDMAISFVQLGSYKSNDIKEDKCN